MDGDRSGGTRINYVTSLRAIPPIPPTTILPYTVKTTNGRFPAEVTQFKEYLLFVNQGITNGHCRILGLAS